MDEFAQCIEDINLEKVEKVVRKLVRQVLCKEDFENSDDWAEASLYGVVFVAKRRVDRELNYYVCLKCLEGLVNGIFDDECGKEG